MTCLERWKGGGGEKGVTGQEGQERLQKGEGTEEKGKGERGEISVKKKREKNEEERMGKGRRELSLWGTKQ
jgi:hypothetical protein